MMCSRRCILILVLLLVCSSAASAEQNEEADQQINDFSLAGYGDRGQKSWDLAGTTADIFDEIVKLDDVVGNMYGESEDIHLTADRGDFNRVNGTVQLEENVTIQTSGGATLTTDRLQWDRKEQLVSTKDVVNLKRDNLEIQGSGAQGKPDLGQVSLDKDVQLDIHPPEQQVEGGIKVKKKTTITCDGPLEIDYVKNVATFNNNVKVVRPDSTLYSDTMYVYFIAGSNAEEEDDAAQQASPDEGMGLRNSKIDKIVARGNVRVVRGENISYSEEAVYTAADRKITLRGRPKLVIVSTEELDAPAGD